MATLTEITATYLRERIRWVAEWKKAKHEAELAELVADGMREDVTWPTLTE